MIRTDALGRLEHAITAAPEELDGWLLFDFRGINPIMAAVVGPEVVGTRRAYVYFPRAGRPTALVHAIDAEQWRGWPDAWEKRIWVRRETLAQELGALVGGRRIAVEYSPDGAVPYVDYLPAGTAEFLRRLGATLVCSAPLVTRYCSVWSDAGLASHRRAAGIIAGIAREGIARAGERARSDEPMSEFELATWIRNAIDRAGLTTESGPSVCYGPNAARNHYDPTAEDAAPIIPGALLLVDLWATEPGGIYADQTWMGAIGAPGERDATLWNVIREARDAALDLLRERTARGTPPAGAEVDRAARDVIHRHGYADCIQCRTGHSIDHYGLHGYGPTIDDTESFDDRALIPGVGFSIEPGIYIPGQAGVRSEVNVHVEDDDILVTPDDYQSELIVV
ncbi:MAG TPA: M24 family metallopeptidase [Longimicrobiales bacterium]